MPDRRLIVDLRSDNVTKPSDGMRAAMAAAEVGDDGLHEDPTVTMLEEDVARRLGHQAALFVPTCTMANLIGVQLLLGRGDELLCATSAELVTHAHGGLAAVAGISTRTTASAAGLLDAPTIAPILSRAEHHTDPTRALAVEQTANRVGGRIYPWPTLTALRDVATANGLTMFCDGARLWNANIATGIPLHEYGQLFDALSVSLSKGLGCPLGALVVGSTAMIERGRGLRKQLGGAMHQAGIVAAAGTYALEHHLPQLGQDHRRAAELAETLARFGVVDPAQIETNLVMLDLSSSPLSPAGLVAAAAEQGVRCCEVPDSRVRLAFHLDVTDEHLEHTGAVLSGLLRRRRAPARRRPAPHPVPAGRSATTSAS